MSEKTVFEIDEAYSDERIDKVIAAVTKGTRSSVQKNIEDGNVLVNGEPVSKNYRCSFGDEVEVSFSEPVLLDIKAENIPLDIRYEDESLLVVNKPKGMVVHPAPGSYSGTLVNALMYHCGDSLSGINGIIRPGIVHRIDKDTSGLLIVAKNDFSHNFLAQQIKEHSFTREYRAVIIGHLKESEGVVDAPIGRNPKDRKKMAVTDRNSKNAVTHYSVLEEFSGYSLVKLKLETGRTHQIRVHMAYLGHPVAGDELYGGKRKDDGLSGQCLHAGLIGFIHPVSKEYIEISSEYPEYFEEFLRRIG
ncbi:MAG: RluA family pseudouridine synthase [Clostridiales bacterium]|nr:RluA family pseudouridine synthase [Clostridiales bacterium]